MPPKVTVTREEVVKAAFEILRETGRKGLSARNIGKKLGCSTQPIYSLFRNMLLLEEKAIAYAAAYATKKFLALEGERATFLDMGVGYVRMASEEKELFNLLYNSGDVQVDMRRNSSPINAALLIEDMRQYERLRELDTETLYDLLNDMWVFTHGLAVLMGNSNEAFDERYVRTRIARVGESVIGKALSKK